MLVPADNTPTLKTTKTTRDALRQRASLAAHSDNAQLQSLADGLDLLLDDVESLLVLLADRNGE